MTASQPDGRRRAPSQGHRPGSAISRQSLHNRRRRGGSPPSRRPLERLGGGGHRQGEIQGLVEPLPLEGNRGRTGQDESPLRIAIGQGHDGAELRGESAHGSVPAETADMQVADAAVARRRDDPAEEGVAEAVAAKPAFHGEGGLRVAAEAQTRDGTGERAHFAERAQRSVDEAAEDQPFDREGAGRVGDGRRIAQGGHEAVGSGIGVEPQEIGLDHGTVARPETPDVGSGRNRVGHGGAVLRNDGAQGARVPGVTSLEEVTRWHRPRFCAMQQNVIPPTRRA